MDKNPEDKSFAELFYDLSQEDQDKLIALVDEFGDVESTVVEDWGDDLECDEDVWYPSCAMDCELCGCHGDCPDCDEYTDDDELSDEEFYGRYGYGRTAEHCDNDDCPCQDD